MFFEDVFHSLNEFVEILGEKGFLLRRWIGVPPFVDFCLVLVRTRESHILKKTGRDVTPRKGTHCSVYNDCKKRFYNFFNVQRNAQRARPAQDARARF